MKKTTLLLAAIIMAACSGPIHDQVHLSGKVYNPAEEEAEVFYYTDFITNNMESVVVPIGEDGMFDAVLPLPEAAYVYVSIAPRTVRMYLKPGASVDLTFDAGDMDEIPNISGDFEKENTFLFAYNQEVGRTYSQSAMFAKMRESKPSDLKAFVDEVCTEKQSFLEDFLNNNELDQDFVRQFQTNILYEKYSNLLQYGAYYDMLFPGDDAPELPDDYYDFLEEAADFRDEHTDSRSYVGFLMGYLGHKLDVLAASGEDASSALVRFNLANDLFTGKSRDMVLAQQVISGLSFGDFDDGVSLYVRFTELDIADDILAIVHKEYEDAMTLAPGREAPGFTLTDINGDEVALADFLGKVVYLDFWASWCGPCIQQIPHAKELKKRMADQEDLVFLYISVDTDEEAWRKMVADREIEGVHVNVPGFSHEVPQSYNLRGVPTFYVIGRDGKIFDNRPPRPSGETIDEVLLSALK